jgi:hypothetical protein
MIALDIEALVQGLSATNFLNSGIGFCWFVNFLLWRLSRNGPVPAGKPVFEWNVKASGNTTWWKSDGEIVKTVVAKLTVVWWQANHQRLSMELGRYFSHCSHFFVTKLKIGLYGANESFRLFSHWVFAAKTVLKRNSLLLTFFPNLFNAFHVL